ncbi:MAG TPA: DMT family transporter [Candidatus Limnocylindrales bacterium]|nr:DMT family transporter [Candidatus Limnocylindrales bacterium]
MRDQPTLLSERRGVVLALGTAAISGLSVYVNAFGVKLVADPVVYTTLKNAVAALLLVALAVAAGGAGELRGLDVRRRGGLILIAAIGGSIPFILFFSGLAAATAPTAAFIHKTLFVWVALLAVPLLGERLGWLQIAALATLLLGQVLVAPPNGLGWGPGETMIAAATLLWSVEVVVAKRLLARVSPSLLAASRLGLGLVGLVGFLAATGRLAGLAAVPAEAWVWVIATGGLLAGYVATWYRALRHARATTVTSVLVIAAVVTAALSALTSGTAPSPTAVLGYLVIVAAVAVVAALAFGPVRGTGRAHRALAGDD